MRVRRSVGRKSDEWWDELEHLDTKIPVEQLKKDPRWKVILKMYEQKKAMFPDLPDSLIIEQSKQELLALRQLMRTGFF